MYWQPFSLVLTALSLYRLAGFWGFIDALTRVRLDSRFRDLVEADEQLDWRRFGLFKSGESLDCVLESILAAAFQHISTFLVHSRQLEQALGKHLLRIFISDYALRFYDLLVSIPRLRQQIKCHLRFLPFSCRLFFYFWTFLWVLLRFIDLALYLWLVVLFLDLFEPHWTKV